MSSHLRSLCLTAFMACLLPACGGGGSGSGSTTTTPPPTGGTTTTNPCTNALVAEEAGGGPVGLVAGGQTGAISDKKTIVDGDPRGRVLEAMFIHQQAERQRQARVRPDADRPGATIARPSPVAADVGDIALIQDAGDVVVPANAFDLRTVGLRFTRSGGGYSVTKIDAIFRSALGTRVTLGDDDSAQIDVPFSFPFYTGVQTSAFVNSDGNITFGEEDKASTDRNIARLLTGPPRVAPFLSDLDPTSGGKVFVNAAADQYTVTWCGVPAFGSTRTTTVQSTLLPDGTIEFKYDSSTNVPDAVIGVSPGHTADFSAADLSVPSPSSATGAIAERFAGQSDLDTIAVGQKFYATHPDNFDQILMWSDQQLIKGAFAYEVTAANEIRGIGVDIYDLSRQFGSAGALRSVVVMDFISKYPDDPTQKFLGENNTLSVMGQEVGHRWLAYVNFRDHTGQRSDLLLGRDLAHWSFFFNSNASVMEGNEITDLGGGQFKTTDAVKRYSRLDQYMMGLVTPSDVPPFFYVESPVSNKVREDAPQIGVTFSGTRRDVLIDDVIAINGPRSPAASASPRTHRQAFIYIVGNGRTADAAQVAKEDTIRQQWESFFLQATEGRMTAITRLH
jgi:hypothetical protein